MEFGERLKQLTKENSTRIELLRVVIKNFQQFQDLDLDLTYPKGHPKAGEPLEKICFIGPNGTGKTTLLRTLNYFLHTGCLQIHAKMRFLAMKLRILDYKFYVIVTRKPRSRNFFEEGVEESRFFVDQLESLVDAGQSGNESTAQRVNEAVANHSLSEEVVQFLVNFLRLEFGDRRLIINVPTEVAKNELLQVSGVPTTNLSQALGLFKSFPANQEVSGSTVNAFWTTLIYHIKKRDSDYQEFQKIEENLDKTVREVQQEFESKNPLILKELTGLWNRILKPAGLRFDFENASNPIQLNDNLNAYIVSDRQKERIPYYALSSGIRNFIFRIGHIYSLYFNREITTGFLFLDEPEKSLFPDFLYDIVDFYQKITHNTQIFMATHSPIVAAQFEPSERIILDFQEDGSVVSRKGVAPIGDDPNDLLVNDFSVGTLLGKEGQENWKRFIELKTQLSRPNITDDEKLELAKEYMKIGTAYGFAEKGDAS